jgi:uncharacterized damage-inducible protein DinB
MRIVDSILTELQMEAGITRRVLAAIPEDKLDWKPHQKSMTLGVLAWHIAFMPAWVAMAAKPDVYDLTGAEQPPTPEAKSEIIGAFEKGLADAGAYLDQLDDAAAMANWKMTMGEKEILSAPRIGFIRSVLLNHTCHHRGQLSVYLRLLDVPVPSIYGPSADENPYG